MKFKILTGKEKNVVAVAKSPMARTNKEVKAQSEAIKQFKEKKSKKLRVPVNLKKKLVSRRILSRQEATVEIPEKKSRKCMGRQTKIF